MQRGKKDVHGVIWRIEEETCVKLENPMFMPFASKLHMCGI